MNTRFDYMYRDRDNYKAHEVIVFVGPPTKRSEDRIRESLKDDGFLPGQVGIPTLQDMMTGPPNYGPDGTDHIWHEVTLVKAIEHPATTDVTFEEFALRFPPDPEEWDEEAEMQRVGADE